MNKFQARQWQMAYYRRGCMYFTMQNLSAIQRRGKPVFLVDVTLMCAGCEEMSRLHTAATTATSPIIPLAAAPAFPAGFPGFL
jgi:hypothetical protein